VRLDLRPSPATIPAVQPLTLDTQAVGVLANPSGECEPQLHQIEGWADEQGLQVHDLGTTDHAQELTEGCGLVIALGGDGTILRALQLAMWQHVPVLGVNYGHLGFLADIDGNELGPALDRVARGEGLIDERTALVATPRTREPQRVVAFNDFVISRVAGYGSARLHVEVSGERVLDVTGDGLVIASPTGSTAYNVEAGGPAVSPTLDAILLTPLAAQGTPLRSMVIDGGDTIQIESGERSAPLVVEVDGRTTRNMPTPATVDVHTAGGKARLVRTRPRTFYGDLARRVRGR
jgi:NAD+ kinase